MACLLVWLGYYAGNLDDYEKQQVKTYTTAKLHQSYSYVCQKIKRVEIVKMAANVSAYCPCEKCCGKFSDGITASGHCIKKGDKFVAAPLPFGTIVDVPGYGKVPVLDRGGSIQGNKIDVFFASHQDALNWGRQYLTVTIEKAGQK